jgi:histidyl-tRNA synthetase
MDTVAGTRDFPPESMVVHNWLMSNWKTVSKAYGFNEYDAPIVEQATLYTRKGGDDILKEMFTLKDGENTLALRPEMTPSVVRMVLDRIKTSVLPIKWFSVPQCWRNETTSRGRKREFYQWNVDIFGLAGSAPEAELFAMLVNFFKSLGLQSTNVAIKVSNRMILQRLFERHGVTGDAVIKGFNIVDKSNKVTRDELRSMMKTELGVQDECADAVFKLIELKSIAELQQIIPGDSVVTEMQNLFNMVTAYGISDWVVFDPSIVRGLSYYTGMVFEAFFVGTEMNRAMCGGGRYDNLFQSYGYGECVPSVGFGMGDVVIMEGLQILGLMPKLNVNTTDFVVIPFKNMYTEAIIIAELLRSQGKNIDMAAPDLKMKDAISYADRIGVSRVVIIAPDEYKANSVVIKNLRETDPTKKQTIVEISQLASI